MTKDPAIFLEHIIECIDLIAEYTKGKTKEEFFASKGLQDSVIRRIEIMGEAVKNIPQNIRKAHPQVPWKKIAAMRDIIAHEYWGIDLKLTWKVATERVPPLKNEILKAKDTLGKTLF
ncbi:MAG: DUF86 domain-containing protein [Sedimentisphaerales bacterium]|nr:DUF86 domain-containing protein [Sedimentisphaerales bacterium]